jgi:hypothetical protein
MFWVLLIFSSISSFSPPHHHQLLQNTSEPAPTAGGQPTATANSQSTFSTLGHCGAIKGGQEKPPQNCHIADNKAEVGNIKEESTTVKKMLPPPGLWVFLTGKSLKSRENCSSAVGASWLTVRRLLLQCQCHPFKYPSCC